MKKVIIIFTLILFIGTLGVPATAEVIEVFIKGIDNGVKSSRDRDYKEAVMNAKLQAIERAGVSVKAITKVENFTLQYDMVETRANAVLLPGFQIMDMGYQKDGTYQVVLSGKVQTGEAKDGKLWGKLRAKPVEFKNFKEARDNWATIARSDIENQFVNNEDGTVSDLKTGLMWARSYEIKETILEVKKYVEHLNNNKFAGFSDWRIPTINETASLLEVKPGAGLNGGRQSFLAAVFDVKPYCWHLWSADRTEEGFLLAYIGEKNGGISVAGDHYQSEGICVACFKAVRSLK